MTVWVFVVCIRLFLFCNMYIYAHVLSLSPSPFRVEKRRRIQWNQRNSSDQIYNYLENTIAATEESRDRLETLTETIYQTRSTTIFVCHSVLEKNLLVQDVMVSTMFSFDIDCWKSPLTMFIYLFFYSILPPTIINIYKHLDATATTSTTPLWWCVEGGSLP